MNMDVITNPPFKAFDGSKYEVKYYTKPKFVPTSEVTFVVDQESGSEYFDWRFENGK